MAELLSTLVIANGRTGTGDQDITGFGFDPQAVIITSVDAAVDNDFQNGRQLSYGFVDPPNLKQCCLGTHSVSNAGTSGCYSESETAHCFARPHWNGSGPQSRFRFTEAIPDGIRINWDYQGTAAARVAFLGLGGDAIEEVLLDDREIPAGTDDPFSVVVPFQPTAMLGFTAFDEPLGMHRHVLHSHGFGDTEGNQVCLFQHSQDGVGTTRTRKLWSDQRFLQGYYDDTLLLELEFLGFTPSGADFFVHRSIINQRAFFLFLKGPQSHCGTDEQPTSISEVDTPVPFDPRALILGSVASSADNNGVLGNDGRLTIGLCGYNVEQACAAVRDSNAVPTSSTGRNWTSQNAITKIAAGSNSLDAQAVATLGKDSYSLNWHTVNAFADVHGHYCLGDAPSVGPSLTTIGRGFQRSVQRGVLRGVA